MKSYLFILIVFSVFYTTANIIAAPPLKIQDIRTVEDVKEFRSKIINEMTLRINSGQLNANQVSKLKKKILLLSSKPLPTQEQIDSLVEKYGDKPSLKEKIKIIRKLRKEML